MLGFALLAQAQEEAKYYLPRTAVKLHLLIEKTTYTPGEFNQYAERFLRTPRGGEALSTYRIIDMKLRTEGVADADKEYIAKTDPKRNIQSVNLADDGVLLSINTEPRRIEKPVPFVPAEKPVRQNPHEYLSQQKWQNLPHKRFTTYVRAR